LARKELDNSKCRAKTEIGRTEMALKRHIDEGETYFFEGGFSIPI
jgi:hypothetical protein